MPSIVIATPSLTIHDAVGNDVRIQKEILEQSPDKPSVYIYAEHQHPKLRHLCISEREALEHISDPDNILIYHHSVYWPKIDRFYQIAQCRVFMKYHNITPAQFFKKYDATAYYYCKMGRHQTKCLIDTGIHSGFWAASTYNAEELIEAGAPSHKIEVLAPFCNVNDFDNIQPDPDVLKQSDADPEINVLFVGRVVPNKGHTHLLHSIARHIEFYGEQIHLTIVGSMSPGLQSYYEELEQIIQKLNIGSFVSFKNQVSFAALKAYYLRSQVFVCMSEHEGFCVPVLEAQKLGLPIIALDRGAVSDTLGPDQLCYPEPNYDEIAVTIHELSHNHELSSFVKERGYANLKRFNSEVLAQKLEKSIFETTQTYPASAQLHSHF
ncbi:MAG: glycosyltransferase family 4 protein [Oligoflexus sp.]